MPSTDHKFTTADVEYLRHGERALLARVFTPEGAGPFPAVIDLHGGAWNGGDIAECTPRDEALARHGIVVLSLDFRHAADGYPTSLQDINYAVRWVKSQAQRLKVDPTRIGLCGVSSGGHLAMLAAMRPSDPRYAAVKLPSGAAQVDATVRAVGMVWPVINPLSRYHHAQRLAASGATHYWVNGMKEKHDTYWKSEANMAEGNPMLALENGEKVLTPPALWVQGRPDDFAHDYHDEGSGFAGNEPERFVSNYRKAGGEIELAFVDQPKRDAASTWDRVAAFFLKNLA